MRINNNFNVLPFYDSLQKQNSKKWYSFGQHYPLICPNNTILPFQFITDSEVTVSSNIEAVNVHSGKVTNLGVKPSVSKGTQADATYYIVKMVETTISAMPEGLHYLRINTNKGYLYSEEFTFNANHEECIKIEYWNENTLNFNSGEINFDDDFRFILYIPSTIGKPEYEFEEELTKRLGYKFIESQTSNKIYKFNFLAPEYICDAMRLIRLCDYIKLTTKFDTFNALSFAYEPKWQDNGDLAAVDVEFDTDCIIQKLESFNRRLKESFYNALLADIDEPVLFSNDIVAQYYTEFTTTSYINGKLIRQLEAINEAELGSLENLVLPIDNQSDTEQKAKKITLASLKNVLIKLADYVTLSTAQNINGEKNFIGGLKVNGSPIIYDSVNKCWKLQGNLVLTGGITMYADDGTLNLPSIYDGLPIDGTTIYWDTDAAGNRVLKAVGGGGTADSVAWNNITGKPSWIGSSKPTYTYSEIQNTPDLSLYAKKTDIPSLSGYATESWVKQQNYATKSTTLSGYGITDAYTKTNVDDLLKSYVTLGGTPQTITGEKNFTGGLKVNGSPIYYDTEKKYWKLEGDLLVTGGVTMYGSDSSFTPSTIMDAIAVDGTTISKSGGVLKVIGGTGGGVADSVAWGNITGKPTWIGSSKPSYSYSEITGAISTTELQNYLTSNSYLNITSGDNRYLTLSGGTITGELFVSSTSNNRAKISLISAADVPNDLVFGTNGEYHWSITSRDSVEGRYIGLYNNKVGSDGWVYKVDFDNRVLDFMNTPTVNGGTIWHRGNDGSGSGLDADLLDGKQPSELNVASAAKTTYLKTQDSNSTEWYDNYVLYAKWATDKADHLDIKTDGYYTRVDVAKKLNTARTIWGQSFDGSGNVSGDLSNTGHIISSKHATYDVGNNLISYRYGYFQWVGSNSGATFILGANNAYHIYINTSGNVGIGTASPTYKLDVNGVIRANGAKIYNSDAGVISLYRTVADGGSYVDYYPLNQTSQKWRVGAGSVDEFFYEAADGSNLARIIHNATTGTRFEVGRRFLSVQPSGSDADRSVITLISNGDSPTDFIMGSGNYAWSITSRNSAEGHLLGFYSALSGQYAMRVYKEGNVLVTGGITMYSDQRKKTILNHVELSLKQIAEAPLIEHYYNSDDKKTTHVGSIAQYWASMNDWFCKLDSEGFYTMEIQNAALASAISIARELDRYETKTDKDIKKLKKRICELEEEVERLKSA